MYMVLPLPLWVLPLYYLFLEDSASSLELPKPPAHWGKAPCTILTVTSEIEIKQPAKLKSSRVRSGIRNPPVLHRSCTIKPALMKSHLNLTVVVDRVDHIARSTLRDIHLPCQCQAMVFEAWIQIDKVGIRHTHIICSEGCKADVVCG
ncbi:hypothetical protein F5051DRAFT_202293 [Lentinula edodes]|nr:hypothetical protein F5051DRAFT_202293 [Lentinula edodes]